MLRLKKSLGQNFLSDKNVINKISSLDNLKNQIIVEIGPGSGNLTESIIKKNPKKIILVEKDQRFSELLREKLGGQKNLEIHNQDILEYTFDEALLKELSNNPSSDFVISGVNTTG